MTRQVRVVVDGRRLIRSLRSLFLELCLLPIIVDDAAQHPLRCLQSSSTVKAVASLRSLFVGVLMWKDAERATTRGDGVTGDEPS